MNSIEGTVQSSLGNLPIDIDLSHVETVEKPSGPARQLLTPIPNTENDFQFSIDNSSLERFTTCSRSTEYYILRRRESAVYSPALSFGKAVHSALELKYRHGDSPAVRQHQLETVAQQFQDHPTPLGDHRTLDRAMEVVEKYNKMYPNELFEVAKDPVSGEPLVEVKFELPLGKVEIDDWVPVWPGINVNQPGLRLGIKDIQGTIIDLAFFSTTEIVPRDQATHVFIYNVYVLWTGRIDLIARMDGQNWILDHKTTSIMGPQFFEAFQLDNAAVGYAWSGQQLLGQPIAGLILNALGVRKPTKTGTATEFERKRFVYNQWQLEEWHENTLVLVSDFLHHLRRGFFPMETKWCFGKYGKCPYHEVCLLPPQERNEALKFDNFKNVTWSPLED